MRPEKQSIPINFVGGLDTKTDEKQVGPANFLSLNNMVFNTGGRLTKRNGYDAKGTSIISQFSYTFPGFSSTVASGSFVSTYQNELVLADGRNLYSYSNPDDKWVYKGRLESSSLSTTPIYQNQYHQILADSAINNATGYTLYAWEQWTRIPDLGGSFRGIYYSLFDNTTGLEIFNASLADTNNRPKCVAIGNFLYLVYYDTVATSLKAFPVNTSGAGSATTLANNIDTTTPNYDLLVNNSLLYVAYCGTGTTVKVASFNSALAAQANVSKATETANHGIGIFPDASNNVWTAYNNGTATKAFIMNSALSVTVLAPTVVDSGGTAANVKNVTGCFDGTQGVILYDQQGAPAVGQDPVINNAAVPPAIAVEVDNGGSFTQPAVGAAVSVTFSVSPLPYLGQIVFIATGGYYYVDSVIVATLTASLINLGYVGNAAPAAVILDGEHLYPVSGNTNALITYNTLTSAGVVGTAANFMRSVALNSRAFAKNSIAHVMVSYDSLIQPVYFLAALYNISSSVAVKIANVSAKVFDGEAGGIPYRSILPSVNIDSSGEYNVALPKRIYAITKTESTVQVLLWFNGIFNVSLNLAPSQVSSEELGRTLIVGSGTTVMYDGQEVVEQGFHIDPENVTAVLSTSSGSLSAGSYGYQIVYQWIDANGLIYKSAPSPVLSLESPAPPASFVLTIPTLRATAKGDVTITIYRTLVDGSVYYRVDTQRIAPGAYPINNSLTTDTITITDGIADTQIVGNEQLYTLGEIENIGPPCASVVTNFKERAILLPDDNRNSFWYSKQIVPGSPVEFSDTFIQNVDSVGGDLVTAAPMDDKLILYKGASVYYMTGSGPAPSGANNDFSEPLLITTDCGSPDRTSIVQMPKGHMFKSEKGIYLLDRSLQAVYIGAAVEAYNQYTVLSARLIAESNQVRFSLSSGDVLMYDYFYDQWSTFPDLDPVSDCIYQRLHTYMKSNGVVYQETPGLYLDGATPVLLSFTTSWIKLAGLQGYQRAFFFYLLAEYISPHQLSLAISYDFSDTPNQTTVITPNSSRSLENWRVFLSKQRCQSFQIALQEVYTGTPGQGFNMSGLNLIVGMKSRFRTISSAQSAG